MEYFLDVILPIPLERMFTYRITQAEATYIKQGMRVAVPFGKSKLYTGLAFKVHQDKPLAYEAKDIEVILDDVPLVNPTQLKHWQWIASYYMCTLGEVVRSGLPSAFLLESETMILPNTDAEIDETTLDDDEFLVIEALKHQSSLLIKDVVAILGKKTVLPVIQRLVAKKGIQLKEDIQEKYTPKTVKYIRISETLKNETALAEVLNTLSRAPKQAKAVLAYYQMAAQTRKAIKENDLAAEAQVSKAVLKALAEKKIFEIYHLQTDRVQFEEREKDVNKVILNEFQAVALNTIQKTFEANKVCLLHGVTSAGKTEVYIKLIKQVMDQGKQVLYLLPEIALTSQLINRLKAYFGNAVGVYHSKYNVNERVEVWNSVLQQKESAQIVIGARSALFLPFQELGLVIIDEEHESSFKQFDPAPRFHARDAAIVLAQLHKSACLLGSATPSLESYANAKSGKYGLAKITRRYGNVLMPEIELVDIKEATRKKRMQGHFSERLFKEIEETLAENEQIILFQNRRGFAPIVECTTCGHSVQCPNCDVSLTYHQHRTQLRCHYCGYHVALPKACEACGNATLDTKGFGTEQIQEELKTLFPNATVGRMDLDTTRGKYGYQKIIAAFESQEMDILVGTQMVTKGLDFRNVGLVGIMNADSLLNFPDYRAHERSFQLMVQVAGRAGRTQKRGKVLIQTYNPYHQILQQVSTYDYEKMFAEQVYEREQFKYPPATRIMRITLKDRDYNKLNEAAEWFAASLRNSMQGQVLGPEYPAVSRIRNEYIKHILIKFKPKEAVQHTKKSIKRIQLSFDAIARFRSIKLVYNVDHI
ncbi:primosomal protein N' [Flavobacterium sp. ASW18X]|uniref:replication restart helicase PriA n=1 Tax=Flavobacterium sp. ASW18X TaxID=2572595 RepID=UPI0010ADA605|nr:primosomal protein N' [Flavobacterium sp. ASW18X]TKD60725.1 primosomal protein N' [Flavobacterium sp. ASW18X]